MDFIILDELGYLPFAQSGGQLLFHLVVGLAGAAIMADLKLGRTQFGLLGSSFFFLFSISAILVGFIVNRVQARWVILCLSLVWAAVQFPMIGMVSFTTLMICRIILGAGEGPGFSVLHFSQKDAGWITILPWVTGAAVVLLAGWFSQFLVAHGMSTRRARGILGAAPLLVGGLILLLIQRVDDPAILIGALTLGSGLSGAIYVVCLAMIGEFTPEPQRGAMLSIYGAIYPIAGILAPLTIGNVLQQAAIPLDGYLTGFAINGAILITSGVLGLILLRPDTERARLIPAATFASTRKPTAPPSCELPCAHS